MDNQDTRNKTNFSKLAESDGFSKGLDVGHTRETQHQRTWEEKCKRVHLQCTKVGLKRTKTFNVSTVYGFPNRIRTLLNQCSEQLGKLLQMTDYFLLLLLKSPSFRCQVQLLKENASHQQPKSYKELFLYIYVQLEIASQHIQTLQSLINLTCPAPGLQGFLFIVSKYYESLHEDLAAAGKHTSWFDWWLYKRISMLRHRRALELNLQKLRVLNLMLKYAAMFQPILQDTLCPFLQDDVHANHESLGSDIINILKDIEILPFLVSLSRHYQTPLRLSYQALIKVTASSTHAKSHSSSLLQAAVFTFYNAYYIYFNEEAAKKCIAFMNEKDFSSGIFLWNLPETPGIREIIKATYKNVKFYQLLAVPYTDKYQVTETSSNSNMEFQKRFSADIHEGMQSLRVNQDISEEIYFNVSHESEPKRASITLNDAADHSQVLSMPPLPESYKAACPPIHMRVLYSQSLPSLALLGKTGHSFLSRGWFLDRYHMFVSPDEQPPSIADIGIVTNRDGILSAPNKRDDSTTLPLLEALEEGRMESSSSTSHPVFRNNDTIPSVTSSTGNIPSNIRIFHREDGSPSPRDTNIPMSTSLLIYFHGGGFVALSSFSHEMYTRKWAIDTEAPMIAVDYKLAPEYAYPVQAQECYFAYRWALDHAAVLGTSAERVILIGDSAGGNLAASVIVRAVAEKDVRIPDGLVMAYPALYLHPSFSMSRLASVIDPLLNIRILMFILTNYARNCTDTKRDPFLSPATAPDEILRRFPPVRIVVGDLDPLLDDSVYFYRRLRLLNKDVQISVQEGYGHAFFNFVYLMPEIKSVLDLVSVWLLDLFGHNITKTEQDLID